MSAGPPPPPPQLPIDPPPRYSAVDPRYPTRSKALQTLIEAPPPTRRQRSSSVVDRASPALEDGSLQITAIQRRMSGATALQEIRSMRLIGPRNDRYKWEQYLKSPEELAATKNKKVREYYERNNELVKEYMYIDRLLDSSLPYDLINQYNNPMPNIPEEGSLESGDNSGSSHSSSHTRLTAKDIQRISERTPLLEGQSSQATDSGKEEENEEQIVNVAIYINLAANTILLIGKVIVTLLTSSLSVLASLVDSALDFLSTAIVWTTTHLIRRSAHDKFGYPVGRHRLEPIGVLIFSVIMITSFFQVLLECLKKLLSDDDSIVQLTISAIGIMAGTVVVKFLCWLWCRLIKNSSVQALAQDAMTDVVFNTFSIIFPLVGYYLKLWWLDPLGGLLLSLYVIFNWSVTSREHIRNLAGTAATPTDHSVLLYLTMRFAGTIKQIQSLQAYHAGDRLNVEVDIVCDESLRLRETHDLGESLQYVLESVPNVERAFVHVDYAGDNLPNHLEQDS